MLRTRNFQIEAGAAVEVQDREYAALLFQENLVHSLQVIGSPAARRDVAPDARNSFPIGPDCMEGSQVEQTVQRNFALAAQRLGLSAEQQRSPGQSLCAQR